MMGEQAALVGMPGNGKSKAGAGGKDRVAPRWLEMQSTRQLVQLLAEVSLLLKARGLPITYSFRSHDPRG